MKISIVKSLKSAAAVVALALLGQPSLAMAQGPGGLTSPPAPAPPRSVQFPQPVEKTLANGLRVIVVPRAGTPVVAAQLSIRSGGEIDPADKSGVADFTASLLTKGTQKRTAPQIAEAMEALGGSIGSAAGWDSSSVSVAVMTAQASKAMSIMADVVRNPVFAEEEIERYRTQVLDDLSVNLSQPGTMARFVASRVVFGDGPYGHPLSGTPETVGRIKRDDVVRVHQTYYRPDNAILVIGGDILPKDAYEMAEQLFGDWKSPKSALPAANEAAAPASAGKAGRVVVVDKPDAGQTAVTLVRPGIRRADPEYYTGIVTNTVLGGGYSARLNQEVRIKRGLSYGAGSSLAARRGVGPFSASTQTKNESGAEVAALLLSELRRLSSTPIPQEEMTPRKATLSGNFARALETTAGLVGQISDFALLGVSLDTANSYIASVSKVTGADVAQFAGKRLAADGASLVLVGNASKFLEALKKDFPNVEVIPEAELDLNSATLRKAKG